MVKVIEAVEITQMPANAILRTSDCARGKHYIKDLGNMLTVHHLKSFGLDTKPL